MLDPRNKNYVSDLLDDLDPDDDLFDDYEERGYDDEDDYYDDEEIW